MERLHANLHRTGLRAETVVADLRKWKSDAPFDAVLLDAPCTATGTFRRHPDVLHRIGLRQIGELADLQTALMDRAATWVKPGGSFIYATCSLEPEEGEKQAAAFLERNPDFTCPPIVCADLPADIAANGGQLRTLPGMLDNAGGLDGFFITQFMRG
jgi:16S rRNA (cytosine967-C5)-methyltransferase